MKSTRTLFTGVSALAVAVGLTACGPEGGSAAVEDYPQGNVEMIVGFAAGGHNDTVARKFAEGLSDELGERVLVVNREGGGGSIAVTEALSAEPDGHTLLFAPTGAFTSTMLQQDVAYEIDDFRSITPVAENPFVVAVPGDSEYESFDELIAEEDRLTYSAYGEGHNTHLIGETLVEEFGLDVEMVAFQGSAPALQAISNGSVDFGIQSVDASSLASGDIRALAITTDFVPDVLQEDGESLPSVADYGAEEAMFSGSQALAIQKDAPDELVEKLREASENVTASEEFIEFVEGAGNRVPEYEGEAWFTEFMPAELERFRNLYEQLGIPMAE